MKYSVTFARNKDIDNIQHETVNAKDEQDARSMFTVCDCYVYGVEIVLPPDRDDAAILQAAHNAGFPDAVFVETEMSLIDRVHMVHGEAPEPNEINWNNHVIFDADAIGKNIQTRSAQLKAEIDARQQAAAERYNNSHPYSWR